VNVSKANYSRGRQNQKDGSLPFCLGFDIAGADAKEPQIARKKALVVAGMIATNCLAGEALLYRLQRLSLASLTMHNFSSKSRKSSGVGSLCKSRSALEAAEAEHLASLSAVAIAMFPRRWLAYVGASGAFLGVEQWVLLKAWGERP
jgi:hypothetical protein